MLRKTKRFFALLLAASLLLGGCASPAGEQAASGEEVEITASEDMETGWQNTEQSFYNAVSLFEGAGVTAQDAGGAVVDNTRVYRQYTVDLLSPAFLEACASGNVDLSLLSPLEDDAGPLYGAVLVKGGALYGECVLREKGAAPYTEAPIQYAQNPPDYSGRQALFLDETIISGLTQNGYAPADTRALSLILPEAAAGVLFTDGEKSAFFVQQSACALESGRLYPVEELPGLLAPDAQPDDQAAQAVPAVSPAAPAPPVKPAEPQPTAAPQPTAEPAQSAAPQKPGKGTLLEAFSLDPDAVGREYAIRYSDQTAAPTSFVTAARENENNPYLALAPVYSMQLGQALTDVNLYTIELVDGTKYRFTLFEKGVMVSKADPEGDLGPAEPYLLDADAYGALIRHCQYWFEQTSSHPSSWLHDIRESRISSITVRAGSDRWSYAAGSDVFPSVVHAMRQFSILPGSVKNVAADTVFTPVDGAVEIAMKDGAVYNLELYGDNLLVKCSAIPDYALQYRIKYYESEAGALKGLAAGKSIPLTAKPVIYLYPREETKVSVKLYFKGELQTTIPAYGDGWQVTAFPDGTILDADGKHYPYLFWDGNSDTRWRFDRGFCVPAADTEGFLEEKLSLLGLSDREKEEFIDFWLPILQQNPYNLITFSKEQYEALAPLAISPAPDSLLRVHMVYRPEETMVSIPPQELHGFMRQGFTVVEWGGSLAR